MAFLEMISKIVILQKNISGLVQSLTLIGYSSELYDMAEADELYRSYNIPHNYGLTPDTVLPFGGR